MRPPHPLTGHFVEACDASEPSASGDYPVDAVVVLGRRGCPPIYGWVESVNDPDGCMTMLRVWRPASGGCDHDLHRLHLRMDDVTSIRFVADDEIPASHAPA